MPLIGEMVTEVVATGKTPTTGDFAGIRLDQMVQKTLCREPIPTGIATPTAMSKIPNDDNSMQSGDANYTAMEHHWDESFGYFGAA